MAKYKLKEKLNYNNKEYAPGDVVNLDDNTAKEIKYMLVPAAKEISAEEKAAKEKAAGGKAAKGKATKEK